MFRLVTIPFRCESKIELINPETQSFKTTNRKVTGTFSQVLCLGIYVEWCIVPQQSRDDIATLLYTKISLVIIHKDTYSNILPPLSAFDFLGDKTNTNDILEGAAGQLQRGRHCYTISLSENAI